MGLLEKMLIGITKNLDDELNAPSLTKTSKSSRATVKSGSPSMQRVTKISSQVLQVSQFPLSLKLSEYKNALSIANPKGDSIAAQKFQQLVDSAPGLNNRFMTSPHTIEKTYGMIVNEAKCEWNNTFLNGMLENARFDFDSSKQAQFVGSGDWRVVEAVPNDWYVDDGSGYTKTTILLENNTSDAGLLNFLGDKFSSTLLTLGNESVPLSKNTRFSTCELEFKLVRFIRPWLHFPLFETSGWWLTGQQPGYCSSGCIHENSGILPLINSGMILVRSAQFTGIWDLEDKKRVDESLAKNIDVYVGPYRLKTQSDVVSTVTVAAWISELVPLSPKTVAASVPLVFHFENNGSFTAICRVRYICNGEEEVAATRISAGNKDQLEIPEKSTDVVVVIRAMESPKDAAPAFRKKYAIISGKRYVITGTSEMVKVSES